MADITTISINLDIPNALIAMGAIDLYAASKGWKAKIQSKDDQGNIVTIDNPVASIDFAKAWFKKFVANDFKRVYSGTAALAAKAQIEALLPDDVK